MLTTSPRIAEGDLVIVYEDFRNLHAVRVKPPQVFSCRFGAFPHASMLGRRFGERMAATSSARGSSGYVYLLPPSAELWTATLPHRTQILYIADISMITLQLELLPGAVVVEAGTGSGSLSHALARAVGSSGHLHTFEFNAQRAQLAAAEFTANGLAKHVTCRHGDVCAPDFSYETAAGLAPSSVDAAIFDLPQPWDAVARFAPYLRPGGRLCCFSPCIEQVARTLEALPGCGFTGAEVIEAIVRTHEVRAPPAPHSQPDALTVALEEAAKARAQAQAAQTGTGNGAPASAVEATVKEVATEATAPDDRGGSSDMPKKRGRDDPDAVAGAAARTETATTAAADAAASDRTVSVPSKRPRADGDQASDPAMGTSASARGGLVQYSSSLRTRPHADMRGHTGFLLFCTKHVG